MARGNFGERLKRERELREVSVQEVTTATRISARYLEALENEDWGRLPGGAFNRGFVRAVARYLGLNEEDLLAEYDGAYGSGSTEVSAVVAEPAAGSSKGLTAGLALAIAVIVVLLTIAGLWVRRRYAPKRRSSTGVFISILADAVLLELNEEGRVIKGSVGTFGKIVLNGNLRHATSGNPQP